MSIMTNHSEHVNDDYDPEANLDDVLAALADIDHVAFEEATSFVDATAPALNQETDDVLAAFLASNKTAAKEAASFMEATAAGDDPFLQDRRIMRCLKDGRIDD